LANSKIRVLASTSKPLQQKIAGAVKGTSLSVLFCKLNELEDQLKRTPSDFVILDDGEDLSATIDGLTQKLPEIAIVVLLPKEKLEQANQILLAGARAFVPVPFSEEDLIKTITRLHELQERSHSKDTESRKQTSNQAARLVTFFSPRGGVGCTTLAVNVALAVQKNTENKVLLVDAKENFGHVDLMLNIKPETTVTALLPYIDHLESRLIESVVQPHVSGIFTLLGPQSIEEEQNLQADHMFKIANALKEEFNFILVDCGNQINEKCVTWMDVSQRIFLVMNPNLSDLRDIRRFLEFAKTLNIPAEKFALVLTKAGLKGGLREQEIEDALNMKILASIPHDETRAVKATNRGVPVMLDEARSPLGRSFTELAQRIIELLEGEPRLDNGTRTGRRDLLTTTSRLG
jgi:pilus assembly protein CpaE